MSDDVLICIFWEYGGKMCPLKKSLSNTIIPWGSKRKAEEQHIIPGYNVMHRTLWLTALVICQMTR